MSNDIESLRVRATDLGLKFSGNTGVKTLQEKIAAKSKATILGDTEPLPEIIKQPKKPKGSLTFTELRAMDVHAIPKSDQILIRQVVRAKALRLRRVSIQNLDPSDADLQGAIITVMNKYTGKVSKFIPFSDETGNGYHVPQILLNFLQDQKFVMRKANKNSQFGVKTYKTTYVKKFNVTILPDLTPDELKNLADRQAASGSIGTDD